MSGKRKHTGGRPTVMTEDVLRKLREAFLMGCTDEEACFAADIGTTAFYNFCAENPEFAEKKAQWKQNPVFLARRNVLKALEDGDKDSSWRTIEKKDGKPTQRNEHSGPDGGPMDCSLTIRFVGEEDARDTDSEAV